MANHCLMSLAQNVPDATNNGHMAPMQGNLFQGNGSETQPNVPNQMPNSQLGSPGGDQPNNLPMRRPDDRNGNATSYVVLQPGESITLTYSGVITVQQSPISSNSSPVTSTPIVGNTYTIELAGEGFQNYTVTATEG